MTTSDEVQLKLIEIKSTLDGLQSTIEQGNRASDQLQIKLVEIESTVVGLQHTMEQLKEIAYMRITALEVRHAWMWMI